MNKYYLEKNVAKYLISKKYISMKQNILIFEKHMLNILYDNQKKKMKQIILQQ